MQKLWIVSLLLLSAVAWADTTIVPQTNFPATACSSSCGNGGALGANWDTTATTNVWSIASSKAYISSGSYYYAPAVYTGGSSWTSLGGSADQWFSVGIPSAGWDTHVGSTYYDIGPAVRTSGTTDATKSEYYATCIAISVGKCSTVQLVAVVNSVRHNLTSFTGLSLAAGSQFRLSVYGSSPALLSVSYNGVLIGSFSDSTYNLSSGSPGMTGGGTFGSTYGLTSYTGGTATAPPTAWTAQVSDAINPIFTEPCTSSTRSPYWSETSFSAGTVGCSGVYAATLQSSSTNASEAIVNTPYPLGNNQKACATVQQLSSVNGFVTIRSTNDTGDHLTSGTACPDNLAIYFGYQYSSGGIEFGVGGTWHITSMSYASCANRGTNGIGSNGVKAVATTSRQAQVGDVACVWNEENRLLASVNGTTVINVVDSELTAGNSVLPTGTCGVFLGNGAHWQNYSCQPVVDFTAAALNGLPIGSKLTGGFSDTIAVSDALSGTSIPCTPGVSCITSNPPFVTVVM